VQREKGFGNGLNLREKVWWPSNGWNKQVGYLRFLYDMFGDMLMWFACAIGERFNIWRYFKKTFLDVMIFLGRKTLDFTPEI
jgi:hypothetical protein